MKEWHSTEYKLVMQNPEVSTSSLARLMKVGESTVRRLRIKLGLKPRVKAPNSYGIRFINFDTALATYTVKHKGIRIGSSKYLVKAVGILDAYLYAVKEGWVK